MTFQEYFLEQIAEAEAEVSRLEVVLKQRKDEAARLASSPLLAAFAAGGVDGTRNRLENARAMQEFLEAAFEREFGLTVMDVMEAELEAEAEANAAEFRAELVAEHQED